MKSTAGSKVHLSPVSLAFAALVLAAATTPLQAQQAADPGTGNGPAMADLEKHIDAMAARIDSMRQELIDSRSEMEAMRTELSELRRELGEKNAGDTNSTVSALRTSVEQLQENSEIVQAEVKQHEQTKVETASKFPVRIFGSVLFTSIFNSGETDNIDVPVMATPPQPNQPEGSLSATVRQTILGLDATGPHFGEARSSAQLTVDFFGGIPYADTTTAAGLLRLRTAHATLAWPNRAFTLAFDRPILSPREPTSWITLGEPALAWSGNLWTWSPQFEYSQKLSNGWTGEFALIDPAAPGISGSTGLRTPDPAESSRQPGYEAHLENSLVLGSRTIDWGAGGYYSRQAYYAGQNLDAWAGTVDWRMALASPLEISGAFYRGRGIGGLGGGAFKNYVPYDNYSQREGLDDEGGWGQVKWKFSSVLEGNAAAGEDDAFAGELRGSDYATGQDSYEKLARNLTEYGNLIYRPRTYLLFSGEYRQIRSWPITGQADTNHIFGLAAGYLF
jgi:regulator of replication initiation timing